MLRQLGHGALAQILLLLSLPQMVSLAFLGFHLGERVRKPINEVIAEGDHFGALLFDVGLVGLVRHLHYGGGGGWLLEDLLEIDLLDQQLVGFFGVEVVLRLDQ